MFERNIVVSFCQTAPPKWAFSQLGCSVIVWLCYPMAYSTLGFPAHHQLLEFAQTHVHRVGNAIQASHPLSSSPSPPAFSFSQHQSLFHWVSSSHQVAKVASALPINIQDGFPLGLTGWISLQSKELSRVFYTTVQNHQFFSTQLAL